MHARRRDSGDDDRSREGSNSKKKETARIENEETGL